MFLFEYLHAISVTSSSQASDDMTLCVGLSAGDVDFFIVTAVAAAAAELERGSVWRRRRRTQHASRHQRAATGADITTASPHVGRRGVGLERWQLNERNAVLATSTWQRDGVCAQVQAPAVVIDTADRKCRGGRRGHATQVQQSSRRWRLASIRSSISGGGGSSLPRTAPDAEL